MANTLNEELEGRFVVLLAETMAPAYRDIASRIYKVEGGFGAASYTAGTGLFGYSPCDGEKWRADGHSVERFATDEEVATVTQNATCAVCRTDIHVEEPGVPGSRWAHDAVGDETHEATTVIHTELKEKTDDATRH